MNDFIEVTATDGTVVNYRYNISTPKNAHAQNVDHNIPTLLFIHPEYQGSEVWHHQFRSTLRRFNLVSFDLRAHGETGGKIPAFYSRVEAADDTAKFMDALNLPPSHIIGNSLGADIALQLAIAHPEKCASTILISPIPDHEPDDTTAGRKEILDLCLESFETGDKEILGHAGWGALQLLFSNVDTPLIRCVTLALNGARSQRNWGNENADILATISYTYFITNRTPRTRADYARIFTPVLIIHSMGDLATPLELSKQLEDALDDAGVHAQLVTIEDAPRASPMTHPAEVNRAIEKFIVTHTSTGRPPTPKPVISPWDETLRELGWVPPPDEFDSDDSDDEGEFKVLPANDKELLDAASHFFP
ncbi:Alpha/Beta hydrolase protein [Flagelloscypha sp. PMI_526]|nr:Alpha/Beta hydrolase protein [Flagelloscypha sp. PMI_526]